MSENAENASAPAQSELPKIELPADMTKDSVRRTIWSYIEKNHLGSFPRPYRRIPNFKGADKACDQLTNLDVFKAANHVKINPDKPQEQARFLCLQQTKALYVPTPRLRHGLFNKIIPPDTDQETVRTCATSRGLKHSEPIDLEDKVKIDLVIVGSVAVSKLGFRIGKGEGFADIEYAMMRCMGAIDENTPVVTCVHDCQVHDLPEELFGEHDLMVDYIVTPTQVIKCNRARKQPTGIIWSQLAEGKLRGIPVLRKMRLMEAKEGKNVALKDEDEEPTQEKMQEEIDAVKDDDEDDKPTFYGRRRRNFRSFPRRRRPAPSASSDAEKGDGSQQEGDEKEKSNDNRRRRFRRRYSGRRRVARRSGGEENGEDVDDHGGEGDADDRRPRKSGRDRDNEREGDEGGRGGRRPFRRFRRRRGPPRNSENRGSGNESGGEGSGREQAPKKNYRAGRGHMHSVYVGSLPRNLRVSDFKGQVRCKDVNPIQVIWHGNNGHAFLNFVKREEADCALKTLEGIVMKEKKLRVEMSRRTTNRRGRASASESKGESDGAAESTE